MSASTPKPTNRSKTRPTMAGVRLLPDEAVAVKALAERRNLSVAELLRQALHRELAEA